MSAGEDFSSSFVDGTYIGDSVIGERVYFGLISVASSSSSYISFYFSLTSVASTSSSSISFVYSSF